MREIRKEEFEDLKEKEKELKFLDSFIRQNRRKPWMKKAFKKPRRTKYDIFNFWTYQTYTRKTLDKIKQMEARERK